MHDNPTSGPCKPEPTYNVTIWIESTKFSDDVCTIAQRKVKLSVQNENEKLAILRALVAAGERLDVEIASC